MTDNIAEELLSEPVEAPAEPTPEAEAPEAVAEPPETPETGEPEVEPPSTESAATVPLSAHIGLRKETDQKIAELKAKLEQQTAEPPPSVFEDEQGAFQALRDGLSSELQNTLLNEGQAFAVREHGQELVDQAEAWVIEAMATSPYIAQQFTATPVMQQHLKAVELFKKEQTRSELENPEQLRARLKEEARQELLAEQQAEAQKRSDLTESIPKSLVGEPSAGGITSNQWGGPTPLDAVIGKGG